jgi:glycosyltransferase involved in cell wall biosynthesis
MVEGVRVVYLQNCWPKRYWFAPEIFKYVGKEISDYDVIHLHNNFSFLNAIVFFYAKKHNIPIVFSAHGALLPRKRNYCLKSIYNGLITKRIIKYAKRLIALTASEQEQYLGMGANQNKIAIVPNGIRLNDYSKLPNRDVFRKRYGISDNSVILLFLGRLHPRKGLDILIDAFSEKRVIAEDIILVIAGPDFGIRNHLEKRVEQLKIANKVLFTGGLFGAQKHEALSGADVFVLTPEYEPFPIALLEALASGLPVIITDKVGGAERIKDIAGLVVPYDKKILTAAILSLSTDKTLRLKLGVGSKNLIKQFNILDRVVEFEKIYSDK